jgi:peptidoglycan/xylan/chitin deacetylase (PgdA/CDA1 family)
MSHFHKKIYHVTKKAHALAISAWNKKFEQRIHDPKIIGSVIMVIVLAVISLWYISRTENPHKTQVVPAAGSAEFDEVRNGNTKYKQLIFTFDGGDGAQSGEEILTILAKHGVRGTFFLTGKFVESNPDLVSRMVLGGHEVYNHTYDHPHLPTLSDRQIVKELDLMDEKFIAISGLSTKPFFRPPYGDRDARVLDVARHAGYRSVYWTLDALDWQESSGMSAEAVRNRILGNVGPGSIILMHIGDSITGKILDGLFTDLENRGYRMVSLTQGLVGTK